jgi:hypothetical protein
MEDVWEVVIPVTGTSDNVMSLTLKREVTIILYTQKIGDGFLFTEEMKDWLEAIRWIR